LKTVSLATTGTPRSLLGSCAGAGAVIAAGLNGSGWPRAVALTTVSQRPRFPERDILSCDVSVTAAGGAATFRR